MGRPKKNQVDEIDEALDEEDQQTSSQGPISDVKLKQVAGSISSLKADMDEIRGTLGQEMKQFEEDGGHKKALKIALSIKNMETIKAQELWRTLEHYMDKLGIFAQHDLFDPIEAKQSKKKDKADKVAASAEASTTAH